MVREFTSADGLSITVGENAAENDTICKHARQNDEWFHVDGAPSAHVVLSVKKQPAPRDSIRDCAVLAKHFSKQKNAPQTTVIHTQIKWVSKAGVDKDKTGSMTLKKKASRIVIASDEDVLARLLGSSGK